MSALDWRPDGDAAGVARAVIGGQKSLNLVDRGVLEEATAAFAAHLDTPGLRCVVLSGRDERAFVGGANLNALGALDGTTAEGFIRSIHDFCAVLRGAPVPVIAEMRGYCLGAGLEIAAACDLRLGDQSVRCGMPEVRVGVPSVVEAALLPGLVGWGKARELMLRGHIIDAAEAHAIGILQHVVPASALSTLTATVCADILAAGPHAIASQKRLFLDWEEAPMSGAIERGVTAFVRACEGDEPRRMIDAFFGRGD